MNILFAASEAAPYVKTGGLGDVMQALPRELADGKGQQVAVVLPLYRRIKTNPQWQLEFVTSFGMYLSWRELHVGVFRAQYNHVTYYFIDNDYYFGGRDSVYGDYDDGERFAYFSKAVLEMLRRIGYFPDILHCNDWQTALIPVLLKASFSDDGRYHGMKTVFSIHNIEYQGKVAFGFLQEVLGLPQYWHNVLAMGECLDFMKGAIEVADRVCTVSRTYSYEIRYPYFSHGLDSVLQQHAHKLSGIVNGIDFTVFDPASDPVLFEHFSAGETDKKYRNKTFLQEKLGLPARQDVPVIAMISRLVEHKGLDLVCCICDEWMKRDVQLVAVGTGERQYEDMLRYLAYTYPDKVSANLLFDPALANQVYAGADFFLMPSKSEPCGLSQLIAMRYGAIPIVRETGGLVDTVPPLNTETLEGRGFTFKAYNAHDMLDAIDRALSFYHQADKRRAVVEQVMRYDSSWTQPGQEYLELYQSI